MHFSLYFILFAKLVRRGCKHITKNAVKKAVFSVSSKNDNLFRNLCKGFILNSEYFCGRKPHDKMRKQ